MPDDGLERTRQDILLAFGMVEPRRVPTAYCNSCERGTTDKHAFGKSCSRLEGHNGCTGRFRYPRQEEEDQDEAP